MLPGEDNHFLLVRSRLGLRAPAVSAFEGHWPHPQSNSDAECFTSVAFPYAPRDPGNEGLAALHWLDRWNAFLDAATPWTTA